MKDIPAHQILPSPQLISHVQHDQLCLIFVKTMASHLSRPSHLSSPLFPAFQTQKKRSEVCSWLGQTKQKGSENFNHKEKPIHLRDKWKFRKERGKTRGAKKTKTEKSREEKTGKELPILIVACREITSGDKGCKIVTSSLLRSCSISPRFAMFPSFRDHKTSSISSPPPPQPPPPRSPPSPQTK